MAHGEWLPWLRANADVLGFSNDSTARRLMQAANRALAHDLSPGDAIVISRQVWGHEVEARPHLAQGTGENEWYTPKEYIEAARKALGRIDLDPASSAIAQKTVKAESFYSKDDDGLTKAWTGRVWLNPPYSQPAVQLFIEKLVAEVQAQHVTEALLLTNNSTDTEWFHIAAAACTLICFTRGRIRFVSAEEEPCASPLQGQAFFYYGKREQSFRRAFDEFGFIR
jgi:ParB family chromosome partitioning protein